MKKTQHLSLVIAAAVALSCSACTTAQKKEPSSLKTGSQQASNGVNVKGRRPSSEGSELAKLFKATEKDGTDSQFLAELNKNKKVTDEFGEVTSDNIDRMPDDLQASAVKELSHSSIFKTRFETDPVFASALSDAETTMKRTGASYDAHTVGGYHSGTSFTAAADPVVSKEATAAKLSAADASFDQMTAIPEMKNPEGEQLVQDMKRINHEIAQKSDIVLASKNTCKDMDPVTAQNYKKYMETVNKQMDRTPCAPGGAFATFVFQEGLGRAPAAAAEAGVEMGEICEFHPFVASSKQLKLDLETHGKVNEPICP